MNSEKAWEVGRFFIGAGMIYVFYIFSKALAEGDIKDRIKKNINVTVWRKALYYIISVIIAVIMGNMAEKGTVGFWGGFILTALPSLFGISRAVFQF